MQRYENQMKIVLLRDYFYRYFTLHPEESLISPFNHSRNKPLSFGNILQIFLKFTPLSQIMNGRNCS